MSQPTQTDRANWRSVKEQVKFYVSIGAFNAYFRNSELIDMEGNQLTVAVGHDYAVDWLTNRLPKIVNEACLYIWGREMAVSFVVRQPESTQLTFIQEVNQQDANTPLTDAKPSFSWGGFEGLKTNFTQVPNEFIPNVIPYVS